MKTILILTSLLVINLIFAVQLSAQQDSLRKEVEVIKAYKPSISDAFKINDIPKIEEPDSKEKPNFNYQINTQPVFSTFTTEPVKAAKMVGEPKPELGKGIVKAGIGNYQTPYAELFYNAKAGRYADFGIHFKHISSNGKVKLMNDDKVDAPYSNNEAELFSNHYFRGSTIHTKLFFSRDAHQYYGYTGPQIPNDIKETVISNWQQEQAFSKAGLQLNLISNESNRADTDYDIGIYYHYFGTKTDQTENVFKAGAKLSHQFETFTGILDASVKYLKTDSIFNTSNNAFGQKQQILVHASPAALFATDNAYLQAGVNLDLMFDDDRDAKLLVTPNIRGEWSPIENIITVYAGASGKLQHNHYSVIAAENPFVNPFQDIENSEQRYKLFGGINGKFTQKFNYRLQVEYASIKNQHFYVLNHTGPYHFEGNYPSNLSNVFDVQYDDMKQLTIGTEIYYTANELFNFYAKGNYYSYDLNTLETPWNYPEFDATFSINYSPEGPLSFNADIIVIGEREATENMIPLSGDHLTSITVMDPVFDLNFGVDYQFSPMISFFGRANNFAFEKYESWLGYTKQGFNLLFGATYSF